MPDAKRPDPKRRSPASRPAKSAKSAKPGGSGRGRPQTAPARREARREEPTAAAQPEEQTAADSIRRSIVEAAEQQSEQRLGSAARRAAILAAVVCVLTLTIAGPVRTYFSQRTEMRQLAASEEKLRAEIADLEQQKQKLADPVYIAAQARERLGFVKPGDIPYQVQLPPGAVAPAEAAQQAEAVRSGQPWYTSLWQTIADEPHNIPSPVPPAPPPPQVPGEVPPPPPPGG